MATIEQQVQQVSQKLADTLQFPDSKILLEMIYKSYAKQVTIEKKLDLLMSNQEDVAARMKDEEKALIKALLVSSGLKRDE